MNNQLVIRRLPLIARHPPARRSVQKNNVTARRRLFACVGLNAKLQLCKSNKNEEKEYRMERKNIDLQVNRLVFNST